MLNCGHKTNLNKLVFKKIKIEKNKSCWNLHIKYYASIPDFVSFGSSLAVFPESCVTGRSPDGTVSDF